jgi:hypothetical protein
MDKVHSYIAIKSKSVKIAPIVIRLNIENGSIAATGTCTLTLICTA